MAGTELKMQPAMLENHVFMKTSVRINTFVTSLHGTSESPTDTEPNTQAKAALGSRAEKH